MKTICKVQNETNDYHPKRTVWCLTVWCSTPLSESLPSHSRPQLIYVLLSKDLVPHGECSRGRSFCEVVTHVLLISSRGREESRERREEGRESFRLSSFILPKTPRTQFHFDNGSSPQCEITVGGGSQAGRQPAGVVSTPCRAAAPRRDGTHHLSAAWPPCRGAWPITP